MATGMRKHPRVWQMLRRLAVGMGVLLLAAPMPAFAFTWLMPTWTFTTVASPGAPVPTASSSDFTGGGMLNLNMGQFTTATAGSSSVKATRDFQVSGSGQTISILQDFETLLARGDVRVRVRIRPLGGGSTIKFPAFNAQAGNQAQVLSTSTLFSTFLSAGNYRLIIRVDYNKKAKGLWDNVPPAPGSLHRFTISAV